MKEGFLNQEDHDFNLKPPKYSSFFPQFQQQTHKRFSAHTSGTSLEINPHDLHGHRLKKSIGSIHCHSFKLQETYLLTGRQLQHSLK